MASLPRSPFPSDPAADPEPVALEAPSDVVRRYLEATAQRRALDDQLGWLRGELELAAAQMLSDARPRGRFVAPGGGAEGGPGGGFVVARLQPTCVFDRQVVGRELQRAGRLTDVAVMHGPALARYLAKEPVVAARLGDLVRYRRNVVLMAGNP